MTEQTAPQHAKGMRALMVTASCFVALVLAAPVTLSSQDLFRVAEQGLGLGPQTAWLLPLSLDAAALTCVAFSVASAWRRERAGIMAAGVWLFALASATFQYVHGMTPTVHKHAPLAAYGFPLLAILGPALLEAVLAKIRGWAREDAGQVLMSKVSFGARWLPFVAFRETFRAWACAKREGLQRPEDAIAWVRQVKAMKDLAPVDRLRYASQALGTLDVYPLRLWTEQRGSAVPQSAVDEFLTIAYATPARRPAAPRTAPAPAALPAAPAFAFVTKGEIDRDLAATPTQAAPVSPAVAGAAEPLADYHAERLAGMSKVDAATHALTHLGQNAKTGDVLRWLAEHDVTSVTRGTIATARDRAATALTESSGAYPMIAPPRAVVNGNRPHLAAVNS